MEGNHTLPCAVGREKAIPKKSGSPKSFPTTPKLHQSRQCTVSALPQSSPNAQGQAGPGEFGPACGEQTHALARTAAAKPGPAWPWALGELWGSALTVHCLLWGSFGVVGKLLGEPDFFGTAFSRPTAQFQLISSPLLLFLSCPFTHSHHPSETLKFHAKPSLLSPPLCR